MRQPTIDNGTVVANGGPDFKRAFENQGEQNLLASDYLRDIRSNWSECDKTVRRTGLIVMALSVLFYLIEVHAVRSVSVGGVSLTKLYIVAAFIPVVVAYLGSVVNHNLGRGGWLRELHNCAYRHIWKDFADQELQLTLYPHNLCGKKWKDLVSLSNLTGSSRS